MEIVKMKLEESKPADYNPRIELKPGMEEYEKLKRSILEFGFVDPPIFNSLTGHLVGGHQRVAVAKDLGLIEDIEVSHSRFIIPERKNIFIFLMIISHFFDMIR